jgi:hypothetical protein
MRDKVQLVLYVRSLDTELSNVTISACCAAGTYHLPLIPPRRASGSAVPWWPASKRQQPGQELRSPEQPRPLSAVRSRRCSEVQVPEALRRGRRRVLEPVPQHLLLELLHVDMACALACRGEGAGVALGLKTRPAQAWPSPAEQRQRARGTLQLGPCSADAHAGRSSWARAAAAGLARAPGGGSSSAGCAAARARPQRSSAAAGQPGRRRTALPVLAAPRAGGVPPLLRAAPAGQRPEEGLALRALHSRQQRPLRPAAHDRAVLVAGAARRLQVRVCGCVFVCVGVCVCGCVGV